MRIENAGNCGYIDGSITIPGTSPLAGQSHTYILCAFDAQTTRRRLRKLAEGILLREHCLQYLPLTTFPLLIIAI